MAWNLKTENDAPVLDDKGLPVFVDDDGTETSFDPNQMHNKILDLNSESKRRREENKSLKDRLSVLDGIDDVVEYRKEADAALKTVANLKDKDLVEAGEIEKLKATMRTDYEEKEKTIRTQYAEREQEAATLLQKKDNTIRNLMISNQFSRSPLFGGEDPKTTLPPDIAETYFGRYFHVEERENALPRVIAKDENNEVILSRRNIGEPAEFDEAIEIIFDRYPGRDKLIRATGGGSGGSGGAGGIKQQTPLAQTKAAYDAAVEAGDVTKQIALKNQLHKLMQDQKK